MGRSSSCCYNIDTWDVFPEVLSSFLDRLDRRKGEGTQETRIRGKYEALEESG